MKICQALAVVGLVASLACGPLAAQGRTGARRFTLSGTVVNGANQPLPGVSLSVSPRGNGEATIDPVISDSQGRFAFGGLAAGDYNLWAEAGGLGTARYGEQFDPFRAVGIHVGGDNGNKTVVFRIEARASLEGVVRDEFGDPMMRATVYMSRPAWRGGRMTVDSLGQKSTDDRGRYRFGNLAPGSYILCVGGGQMTAPLPGPVDYATRVDNRYYGRTCNRALELAPGQTARVDLSPIAGSAATVRGHVRNLPPQTGFSVNLRPADDSPDATVVPNGFVDATQGTFTIRGVPAGRYRLHAQIYSNSGVAKDLAAEIPLDVGGSDIDGLELPLDAAGSLEVAFHGVSEDQLKEIRAMLHSTGGLSRGYQQAKNGVFQFPGVPAGSYRLSLTAPQGSCVESVKLGNSEIRGLAFDIASGSAQHLDVTVTPNCGAIQMRAVRDSAPVPGAKVVLLANGTARDPGDLVEEFTDDEGGFTFSGLAPGHYLVWAWAVGGKDSIAGPSSLSAVEQKATAVDVTAGDPVKVDVPILSLEGSGQ